MLSRKAQHGVVDLYGRHIFSMEATTTSNCCRALSTLWLFSIDSVVTAFSRKLGCHKARAKTSILRAFPLPSMHFDCVLAHTLVQFCRMP